MAEVESEQNHTKKRKQRNPMAEIQTEQNLRKKRKQRNSSDNEEEEEEEEEKKKAVEKIQTLSRGGVWKNLELILFLKSKELDLQSKIKLAFEFVNSEIVKEDKNQGLDYVQKPRLVSFLNDWIQSILISSDKMNVLIVDGMELESCLDFRCWVVFNFCLKESSQSSLSFSPILLRSVSRVVRHALSVSNFAQCSELFGTVSDCVFLLFNSHGRSFNANIDAWTSLAVAVFDLVHKVLSNYLSDCNVGVLLQLSCLVLEPFANFLKVHPNPKNVFPVIVDRLLEPLLGLLVLLDGNNSEIAGRLLKLVEDILSNGLFHSSHIDGFLCIRGSEKYGGSHDRKMGVKESKGAFIKSYHKHLFQKLEQILVEKKMPAVLGGVGHLLILFVNRVRKQKGASLPSNVSKTMYTTRVHGNKSETAELLSASRLDKETSKSIFDIFVQFMEPLVLDVKRYSETKCSEVGECSKTMFSDAHCTLKSVNKLLSSFMHGKLYARTEDTSEGAHLNFLKEVYDTIISFSAKIHLLWSSALKMDDGVCTDMLQLISKEIIVAIGCFLEIEYKVIGNDLAGLWLTMLSFLAIDLSLVNTQHHCLLVPEIRQLGCQLVSVYRDLRQVSNPIFALCKAVRLFRFQANDVDTRCLSSEICVKSVATLICSQEIKLVICTAIKSIPEGQVSGCIRELKMDVEECLQWMKACPVGPVGREMGATSVEEYSILDLSLQADLLGKVLSEVYAFILDSSPVTTGNSILVGNSIKELMAALGSSFSSLVKSQSGSVDEFLLSVIGNRLFNHNVPEGKMDLLFSKPSTSCVLVFFFRIYISCRSLYRQSISLMPPDSSKKASIAMGDLFTAYSGKDCAERTDWIDGGYFSWIIKPSISLLAIIQSVSDCFLQDSIVGYAPLVYILHLMAFQRLVDLNRQIKAFEFLQEKDARLVQIRLVDDGGLSQKESKKWKKLILASRQEAADLTGFMTGYLRLLLKMGRSTSIKGDDAWDLGISSLSDTSLPIAIWWLLCKNTDIWCAHATKRDLRRFLSLLFHHSLPRIRGFWNLEVLNVEEAGCPSYVTLHHISLELLSDTFLYEQTFLCRHLTSRFCGVLEKTLLPLFRDSFSSDADFKSLPDWSEVSNILDKDPVVGMNDKHDPHDERKFPSICTELISCQSLLNLLCWIPKGCAHARPFSVYATYILNIERHLVPSLLNCRGELFLHDHYEILKLFVCCRRALRYLVMASDEVKLNLRQSLLISTLSEDSFSILWLLKSVSAVVGLSHGFSEEETSRQVKDMFFSLMDHTACIFLSLSEGQLKVAVETLISEQNPSAELHNSGERDNQMDADLHIDSSEHFNVWKCVEHMAEILQEQSKSLLVTLKGTVCHSKSDVGSHFGNWNSLSSLISCLQGFLWGIASTLNDIDKNHLLEKEKSSRWKLGHASKLNLCINAFEDFVNYCLNMLLVDDNPYAGSLCPAQNPSMSDCMKEEFSLEVALRTAFKFSGCENDISRGKPQAIDLPYGIYDFSASDPDKENKNSRNSGTNFSKTSRFMEQKFQSLLANCSANSTTEVHGVYVFEIRHLNRSFLRNLLKGESPELAFLLGQLFIASAAILQLKNLLFSLRVLKPWIESSQSKTTSTITLIGTSHFVLSEFSEMLGSPHPFSFVLLDGIIKYLEVLGRYFPSTDPVLSRNLYALLIGMHLRAIGKCISLQGKAATLASHETESSTKTLQAQEGSSGNNASPAGPEQYNLNEFKSRLRMSFKMFIRKPVELHLLSAVQALERALVGVQEGSKMIYELNTGSINGGKVSTIVAAGIDCLDLVLEFVEGHKRSNVVKRHVQSFINALFNIVLHLQSPFIFCQEMPNYKNENDPDPGSVILMCVEVLTKIAARHSLFQMDSSHVAQGLQMATTLFKHFCHLRASPNTPTLMFSANQKVRYPTDGNPHILDRQFSVDLYAACCRLLCAILRHRKSESERCVALLEDSVCILLYCLEMVGGNLVSKKDFPAWDVEEGVKCASFLRRIYEEVRQQKDIFGKYAFHFLSTYILIYSGYGPLERGIRREIDEALRPGLYALIDGCSPADLQQLHTVLGEGPCRTTLATLQHDYKLNFQYGGKV
ncbi:urb2/Npa2 family protein [Tasmannia lanceolata]|uniref:urb2/Npa2 family protein n=1 Tax=Tasmannia lanceolata TaxID=3420 RepID=UPI004064508E